MAKLQLQNTAREFAGHAGAVRPAVYVKSDLGQANEPEQTRTNNLLQGVRTTCYWQITRLCLRSFAWSRPGLTDAIAIIIVSKKDNFIPAFIPNKRERIERTKRFGISEIAPEAETYEITTLANKSVYRTTSR